MKNTGVGIGEPNSSLSEGQPEYQAMDTSYLGEAWGTVTTSIKRLQTTLGHIEQELNRRMDETNAKALPDPEYDIVKDFGGPQYAVDEIHAGIGEHITPAEWATVYTPEHTETVTVPAKINGVQINVLRTRYGPDSAIAKIIEAGTHRPFKGVKVTRKEKKSE